MKQVRAIVLAAGQGKRLRSEQSDLPKVLREANGHALLHYVLKAISFIEPAQTMLVVGYQAERVKEYVGSSYPTVLQEQQLGTGHAVACAKEWIAAEDSPVLCCYGDMPLIRPDTYAGLVKEHVRSGASCTILSYETPLDLAYGRLVCDMQGNFLKIVEDRDCNEEEKKIHAYNAGVYVFSAQALLDGLASLQNNNNQNEYYLTDIPGFLQARGDKVRLFSSQDKHECLGVNTQEDLDEVSALLRAKEV